MIIYLKFFLILISDYRPNEPKPKSTPPPPVPTPPPPPPPPKTVISSSSTTNPSTRQLTIPNRTESKSPSPQRIKVK